MDWAFLSATDHVDIVWPSAQPALIASVSLAQFLQKLDQTVRGYGLAGVRCNLANIDPSASFLDFYSNSDAVRAQVLREALLGSETKAIWCGRGGFGATEVIQIYEQEGFALPTDRVVPLIGFSDITSLHLLSSHYRRPTLHAVMPNFNQEMNPLSGETVNGETSMRPLIDILLGKVQEVSYTLQVVNPEVLDDCAANAPVDTRIIGGNFAVVQRNDGTATMPDTRGAVLFFEDTVDDIIRVRSLLMGVARTGMLDHVTALFFGDLMVSGGTLTELLVDLARVLKQVRGVSIPILQASGFGHGPVNQMLPLGTRATLAFTAQGTALLKASVNRSAY